MNCKPSVNRTQKVVPEGGFEPPTRGFSILFLSNVFNYISVNDIENDPIIINALQKACKPKSARFPLNAALITNDANPPLSCIVTGKNGTGNGIFPSIGENPNTQAEQIQ